MMKKQCVSTFFRPTNPQNSMSLDRRTYTAPDHSDKRRSYIYYIQRYSIQNHANILSVLLFIGAVFRIISIFLQVYRATLNTLIGRECGKIVCMTVKGEYYLSFKVYSYIGPHPLHSCH
jgi:hypothetical protein